MKCNAYIDSIDVFRETQENMEPNLKKRIGLLQTLAIEVAEDNDDD